MTSTLGFKARGGFLTCTTFLPVCYSSVTFLVSCSQHAFGRGRMPGLKRETSRIRPPRPAITTNFCQFERNNNSYLFSQLGDKHQLIFANTARTTMLEDKNSSLNRWLGSSRITTNVLLFKFVNQQLHFNLCKMILPKQVRQALIYLYF